MGFVSEFPFGLELTTKKGVLHRATPLPPAKRMWVRRHLAELEEQGVIERVASAKFASNIVLVDDWQSGQVYRLCTNFIDLNARTKPPFYPLPDQQAVRD